MNKYLKVLMLLLAANLEAVLLVVVAVRGAKELTTLYPRYPWMMICLGFGLFVIIVSWGFLLYQLKPREASKSIKKRD